MTKQYEKWFDPHIEPDPDFDYKEWEVEYLDGLIQIALMAHYASLVPRRLGGEAAPKDLGADKRFSKKLMNTVVGIYAGQWRDSTIRQQFNALKEDHNPLGPEADAKLRSKGAQVDWSEWVPKRAEIVRREARRVCTQLHHSGDAKQANRVAHRLEQEIAQVANLYKRVFEVPALRA